MLESSGSQSCTKYITELHEKYSFNSVKNSVRLCDHKSLDSNILKVVAKIRLNDENEFEF